jgi:hypothetical protein
MIRIRHLYQIRGLPREVFRLDEMVTLIAFEESLLTHHPMAGKSPDKFAGLWKPGCAEPTVCC